MSKKLVIFDWGGIVESHKDDEYNCYIATINFIKRFCSDISDEEILNKYFSCNTNNNGKTIGEISNVDGIMEWFEKIKTTFNFECTFEKFCKVYEEEFMKIHFYKDVVDFAHSLKDICLIGILSNLCYLDKSRIDMQFNLNKFDFVWLSFELQCRKPNTKIYELVEKDCKIKPENILFIDDTLENLIIAKERGWNICHACGYELDKIKKEVQKFLKK